MTFRVGQKVVCVDDRGWSAFRKRLTFPVRGKVYTISSVEQSYRPDQPGLCLRLDEIQNPPSSFGTENNFSVRRFRPVAERKTDISIFTAMLNTSKRGVDA